MNALFIGLLAGLTIWWLWPAGTVPEEGEAAGAATDGARERSGPWARWRRWRAGRQSPPEADVEDLAATLDLLALTLDSGIGVTEALAAVADEVREPLAGHLRQVVAARRWGMGGSTVWKGLPEVWQPAAQALELAQRAGAPPAETLRRAAVDLRRDRSAALEHAAQRLPVLLVIPLGTVFMPAFVLIAVVPLVVVMATQTLGQT